METIRIYVNRNVATCARGTPIVCGNTDYQIEFVLDKEWEAYTNRTARFVWNDQYQDVEFTGNTCMMPPVYNTEKCFVGLIAEDRQQITTAATIKCKKSVKCIEAQPSNEQYVHDILNTDVPNDADDELTAFLENVNKSICKQEGSDQSLPVNPQRFPARITALPIAPTPIQTGTCSVHYNEYGSSTDTPCVLTFDKPGHYLIFGNGMAAYGAGFCFTITPNGDGTSLYKGLDVGQYGCIYASAVVYAYTAGASVQVSCAGSGYPNSDGAFDIELYYLGY